MNNENEKDKANGQMSEGTDERADDPLNPTLKVQPPEPRKVTDAPFDCPFCHKPANAVQMSPVGQGGAVLVFWCGLCRGILSVQLNTGTNPMQRVVPPGSGLVLPGGRG